MGSTQNEFEASNFNNLVLKFRMFLNAMSRFCGAFFTICLGNWVLILIFNTKVVHWTRYIPPLLPILNHFCHDNNDDRPKF